MAFCMALNQKVHTTQEGKLFIFFCIYSFQNEHISLIALFSHLVSDLYIISFLIKIRVIQFIPEEKTVVCALMSSTLIYQGNAKI